MEPEWSLILSIHVVKHSTAKNDIIKSQEPLMFKTVSSGASKASCPEAICLMCYTGDGCIAMKQEGTCSHQYLVVSSSHQTLVLLSERNLFHGCKLWCVGVWSLPKSLNLTWDYKLNTNMATNTGKWSYWYRWLTEVHTPRALCITTMYVYW